MAKKHTKKRTDWEEDDDAEPVKEKPTKHAEKHAGKKAHKGGRKRTKSTAATKAARKSFASNVMRAKGPKQVAKILRLNKGLVLRYAKKKKGGYSFRTMLKKSDSNMKLLTPELVAKYWKKGLSKKTYVFRRKKSRGGFGLIIRGTNYLRKIGK